MPIYKKILLKQTVLLSAIFLISLWFLNWGGSFVEKFDLTVNGLLFKPVIVLVLTVLSLALFPLSFSYLIRIKKGMDIKNLNKIFKAIIWFLIIVIVVVFISVLWEIFYLGEPGVSLWVNTRISFLYHFSWPYLSDPKYGFIDDAKQIIIYLPHIFIAALLYLTFKVNKLLENN